MSTWCSCSCESAGVVACPAARPSVSRNGARDRGPALRRGPGRRLRAAGRHAHQVRVPGGRRAAGRGGVRQRLHGVAVLRRDAGQAHRRCADPRRRGPSTRLGAATGTPARPEDQPRPAASPYSPTTGSCPARCRPRCSRTGRSSRRSGPSRRASWRDRPPPWRGSSRSRRPRGSSSGSPPASATSSASRSASSSPTSTVAEWWGERAGYRVDGATVVAASPTEVVLDVDGVRRRYEVAISGNRIDVDGPDGHVALERKPRFVDPSTQVAAGSLLAPMPGSVVAVHAQVGDEVAEGAAHPRDGGHEDAAHHLRAVRRHGHRARRHHRPAGRGGRRARRQSPRRRPTTPKPKEPTDDDQLHRARGARRPARGGQEAGEQVRPGVRREAGPRGRQDDRDVARDGPERLPRRQHPRGARRWRRRHGRPGRGARGGIGRGCPAADDGRLAGHLRLDHQPVRHRGAEGQAGCPASPTAPC